MNNYDSTKYNDKRNQGAQPGEPAFGDRARLRRARLQEEAINASRPKPSDLGTGTAARAARGLQKRRQQIESTED